MSWECFWGEASALLTQTAPPLQTTQTQVIHPSNSLVNTVHLKGLGNQQARRMMMKDKSIVATPTPQSVRTGVTYTGWHHSIHEVLNEERVSEMDATGNKYLGPRLFANPLII